MPMFYIFAEVQTLGSVQLDHISHISHISCLWILGKFMQTKPRTLPPPVTQHLGIVLLADHDCTECESFAKYSEDEY